MTHPLLLDTDILSLIMRRNDEVLIRARDYLLEYGRFTISIITQYEIQRGLKARHANKQLASFERFCISSVVLPIDGEVADRASSIFAALSSRGAVIGDADILIASTALVHQMGLVTRNLKHFNRIENLHLESWLE